MKNSFISTLLYVVITSQLTACVGLVVAGAAGGALVASDRRSNQMQLDDKQIELRLGTLFHEKYKTAHLNASSYNRIVLLTGEVPDQATGKAVEQAALKIDEVAGVINELGVGANSGFASRTTDTTLTAKVKTAFIEDKLTPSNAFKVTTERGTVFLQGKVSRTEGDRAAEIARTVSGVSRVVKVLDYLSEDDLKSLKR